MRIASIAVLLSAMSLSGLEWAVEPQIALEWLDLPALERGHIGTLGKGLACLPAGRMVWHPDAGEFSSLRKTVELTLPGRPSSATETDEWRFRQNVKVTARFRLGASIGSLEGRFCQPGWPLGKAIKGRIEATVHWTLFDVRRDKIVASDEIAGAAEIKDASRTGVVDLVAGATADSLTHFLAGEAVRKAVQDDR